MLLPVLVLLAANSAACSPSALSDSFKATSRRAEGNIGISATLLESQEHIGYHGTRRFPMQSVYKLPIALAVLHSVEEGKLTLDQVVPVDPDDLIPPAAHSPLRDKHPKGGNFSLEDLLKRSIVDSDGSASDVLLRVLGGTKVVRRYLKAAGIRHIRVLHTEAQLVDDTHLQYQDSAHPDAIVDLLERLQAGKLLNAENTARLLQWMTETDTGHDRLRAGLPHGTAVADKTGTSGTSNELTPATNDVGLITLPDGRHFAIAVFISNSKANASTRNAAIADVARTVWGCWAEGH